MKPFWKKGELSVREAFELLEHEKNPPSYSTVQTVAGRLEKKEALGRVRKIGNAWLFRPLVEQSAVVHRMVDDLLNLLNGAPVPIVSQLLGSSRLKEEDLADIKAIIEQKERERR